MDLALYLRVIWRFKFIVATGLIAAVALSFLSVEKVSFAGGSFKMKSRKTEIWNTHALLFVTQPGFPWGRTVTKYLPGNLTTAVPSIPLGDPQRLSTLTGLYAQLATSDAVRQRLGINTLDPKKGTVLVTAVPGPAYSNPAILPVLDVSASGPTPARAILLANRVSDAFRHWLAQQQTAANIPASQRVVVQVINRATKPKLQTGRGKTLPIIIFLSVLGATISLALLLENLRPRPLPSAEADVQPAREPDAIRQTA